MRIRKPVTSKRKVYAASDELLDDDEGWYDTIEDIGDAVDDIQDAVDEIEPDDADIDIDNNISNHYIAECELCHGVFISAVSETDQEIEKVHGVCPLCDKESDQFLNWIIRSVNEEDMMYDV